MAEGVGAARARELLRAYPGAVRAAAAADPRRKKAGLPALDRWWSEGGARSAAAARKPPHLEKAELVRLVEWKLARGKFRPLLRYARELREADVVAATAPAFEPGAGFEASVGALVALRGVGPATASAVLSVARDDWPFMSDEALNATAGGRTYTLPRLRQLVGQLAALGRRWGVSPSDAEKVLYVLAHENGEGGAKGGGGAGEGGGGGHGAAQKGGRGARGAPPAVGRPAAAKRARRARASPRGGGGTISG